MKLNNAFWVVVALSSLTGLAEGARAQNFNQLIAFGDSSTDTGWFAHASTGIPGVDFFIANSLANGGNAHFTGPGPGNAQILGGFFGLPANPANVPAGTNYAIGGAVNFLVPAGYPGTGNLFPNPALPGTATQISNYLAAVKGQANPNALYLVNSGGNNTTAAFAVFGANASLANPYLLGEAQTLANNLARLQAAGARYIIVSNEYVPVLSPAGPATPTLIQYGTTLLSAVTSDLAAAGVKYIPADTMSVIAAVERNPIAFGITAPITSYACIPPAGWPAGVFGWGPTCAPTTVPNPNYGYLVSADALQTHLWMDGEHLTQAGQLIWADYVYSLLVAPSEISFLAETTIQNTFQTIAGIQQQINLSQRQRLAGWNVWMNGQVSELQIRNTSSGFPSDPGVPVSGTVGFDYHWLSGWLAGAAVTVGNVSPTFSLGGNFTQNEGTFSLYAAYLNNNWWGNLIGSIGVGDFNTNRQVPIGITVQPNNGSTIGTDLSLAGELGYDFHTGFLTHGPVAGFILQQVNINGFTESGSFTSLSFGRQIRNSEVSALGYQAGFDWGIWHPFTQVGWDHEFDPLNRIVTASLTTIPAPSFSMPAVVVGRDWATATVGTEFKIARAWTGLASFTAQVGQQNVTNFGGLLGVNFAFGQQAPPPIVYKS